MKRVAIAIGLSAAMVAGAAASEVPSQTRPMDVTDPALGMTAYRIQVPMGWKFAGTVTSSPGCHANGAGLKFTMMSPDGSMGFSQFPSVRWGSGPGQASGNCPAVNLANASSFLVNIAVPNLRPGATVTAVLPATAERAAQLAQDEQAKNQALQQMAAQYGQRNNSHVREQGARVRIRYQSNGRDMEAQLTGAVDCTDGVSLMGGGETHSCEVGGVSMAYAPAGQLDAFLNSSYLRNYSREVDSNPQWEQRRSSASKAGFDTMMRGNQANQQRILANGQAAANARAQQHQTDMQNAQTQSSTQQAQHQAQMDGYARHNGTEATRQDAVHGSAQQTVLYAGNQGVFQDPSTGHTFKASSDYNHQWISGDGQTMIQTDSHTYDPNGRVGNQGWTELVPR